MALTTFYPKPGHILICDFSRGFVAPEMVKSRPVIVVSRSETHGRKLCTVVPLSTTPPVPVHDWHHPLLNNPLPNSDPHIQVWAKCDMLTTVSFERLDKPHTKTRAGRQYLTLRLSTEELEQVNACIKKYFGF